MPDVNINRELWDGGYDWAAQGEEWSHAWGGSEPQWFGVLYPRLHRLLPANSILEIAPGMGRWTRFLLPLCRQYVGVDISLECVQGCQQRFAKAEHARFVHNDGQSLSEVQDGEFDFIFSFDSLVHADLNVFKQYIPQITQKLSASGVAFIHHSNMGAVGTAFGYLDGPLGPRSAGGRSLTVSRQNVEALIVESGGRVLIQEVINWSVDFPEDCLTVFAKDSGQFTQPIHLYNLGFMDEASAVKKFQSHYSGISNRP